MKLILWIQFDKLLKLNSDNKDKKVKFIIQVKIKCKTVLEFYLVLKKNISYLYVGLESAYIRMQITVVLKHSHTKNYFSEILLSHTIWWFSFKDIPLDGGLIYLHRCSRRILQPQTTGLFIYLSIHLFIKKKT